MADNEYSESTSSTNYSERIKNVRLKYGYTQQNLADHLGVSFATVNRWENNQNIPSKLCWKQLQKLEKTLPEKTLQEEKEDTLQTILDFTASPDIVKTFAEGERLSFGHLMNPTFGTEISNIDPLPHQRIAVYDHLLKQNRLRFLLADDAGAGKTIMAGLYIREMLSRRLLRRILIVTPAGLVGNWYRELFTLFTLRFRTLGGGDFRQENAFAGKESDRVIISIDTLASAKVFSKFKDKTVIPYDLVIFDEAHKLAADRGSDMRVRKTERYCLAEAIAGVSSRKERWQLDWSVPHLLLLTATPHMGKDYPYYALWRLLEPEMLSTPDAFSEYPADHRRLHFIRRTKEEMIYLDGRPLYPQRISDTLGYELTKGEVSEQALYDATTEYLRFVYNRAKMLNREAARLAMSVFQRRLASSTYALIRSFERRIEKLDRLILDIQEGRLTSEQLAITQQRLFQEEADVLDEKAADDETSEEGMEENEIAEGQLLQGVIASSLNDLLIEKDQVHQILSLAQEVYDSGESKFEKLSEILVDPRFRGEKFIVFTEHRDTMTFIVRRLEGMGFTGQVARIHGGMSAHPDPETGLSERDKQVEFFRRPVNDGGARFLICTDAAGEGINLQFCWIMINYDIPWNPARLEQRMGRIHRYGQKHDPVIILNLIAPETREGKVLKVLLDKLEKIRKELQSDKVFDCIGRVFSGISIKNYMEIAVTEGVEGVAQKLEGSLTKEQVEALIAREKVLYGSGGDVAKELPRLRSDLDNEMYFRLLPGYVRQYIQQAAQFVGIEIEGDMEGVFSFRATRFRSLDPLLPAFEMYPERSRGKLSVKRNRERKDVIWIHPGEPVFEAFRSIVRSQLAQSGRKGAIFVDPSSQRPYLFHLALLSIVRKADPGVTDLAKEELLECRLVGIRQYEGAEISLCPVEHLLLLKGCHGLPSAAQRLAAAASREIDSARAYLTERVIRERAIEIKGDLESRLPEKESFILRGFEYQEVELATARAKHSEKARAGNRKAMEALEEVKRQQRLLTEQRDKALAAIRRETELISPGEVKFIAHALIVPSSDPVDLEQLDINVELLAMNLARAFEEEAGAQVFDVHTPELARKQGLSDNPGFDLLSVRSPDERRAIEVKGRSRTADIEITTNEWGKACNMRENYWLYAVYDCATPAPRLVKVQDPFGKLLAREKISVLISPQSVEEMATE